MKIFKLITTIDGEDFDKYYKTLQKAEGKIKKNKAEYFKDYGEEDNDTHYNIEEIEVE